MFSTLPSVSFHFYAWFLSFLSFFPFQVFSGRNDNLWEQRDLLVALNNVSSRIRLAGGRETSNESHILIVTH